MGFLRAGRALLFGALVSAYTVSPAGAVTVNTPADEPQSDCAMVKPDVEKCTLRDAINTINGTDGGGTIGFNIEPTDTSRPVTVDPGPGSIVFSKPIHIDGFSEASRLPQLPPNAPAIVLGGNSSIFLTETADGSLIEGLVIIGPHGSPAVSIAGAEDVTVAGNWIGFFPLGFARSDPAYGIACTGCSHLTIGEVGAAGRNVIGGILGPAIYLDGSAAAVVRNNWIGLAPDGSSLWNSGGVYLRGSGSVTIGGAATADRNVIASSGDPSVPSAIGVGVSIVDSSSIVVQNNFIGTDATGMQARPNAVAGIKLVQSEPGKPLTQIQIGGVGVGNVISGNGDPASGVNDFAVGVGIALPSVSGSFSERKVQGNKIGVAADGTTPLPNLRDNILVGNASASSLIGGTAAGEGNVIAYSDTGSGVRFGGPFSPGPADGCTILGNAIFGNDGGQLAAPTVRNPGLGIVELDKSVPTQNDDVNFPYDVDGGPNGRQNYPVLTAATSNGATTHVTGELRTAAGSRYRVELFSNTACDPSGHGEGEHFLGAIEQDTDVNGILTIDATLPVPIPELDTAVTATATSLQGGRPTSEFSTCITPEVEPPPTGSAACLALQLVAGGRLVQARLACEGARAALPSHDPSSSKLAACRAKAESKFDTAWAKALTKTAKRGETCAFGGSAASARTALGTATDAVAAAILAGVDESSRIDGALRKKVLGAGASYGNTLLAADAAFAKKPDAAKRVARRADARGKLDASVAAAAARAAKKNVTYDGATAPAIAGQVETLTGAFLTMLGGS